MTRKKKIIIAACIAGTALLIAAVTALYFYINGKKTVAYDGVITSETGAPVTVKRDRNGIAHIEAATREDAYYALGYLHAQDRIILVEYYRAMARGWLSSLIGEKGVIIDRLARTLDFSGEAGKMVLDLDPKTAGYLESYVKGINRFRKLELHDISSIANLPATDWAPSDVVSILLLLEWSASFLSNREQVFMISDNLLTRDLRKILAPQLTFSFTEDERNNVLFLKELNQVVRKYVGSFNRGLAFYISPSLTADEQPALGYCNESLNRVFPLWYPVRITAGGASITGATAAGMPFFFSGKTAAFAFVGHNLSLDVQDFYRETTRKVAVGTEYLERGRWLEFAAREETILTRGPSGEMEQAKYRVRMKGDCPVVSDVFRGRFPVDVITVKHMLPGKEYLKSLFEFPFADSVADSWKMTANVATWPKVFLFSSKDDAVVAFMGTVPERAMEGPIFRRGDNYTGYQALKQLSGYSFKIRSGSAITGSEMLDTLPAALNPYKVFNDGGRYRRLAELVKSRAGDPRSVPEILHDRESHVAKKFTPVFHALLDKIPIPSAKLCRVYFKNWNYELTESSVPGAVTHVLLSNLFIDTVSDELKDDTFMVTNNVYWTLDGFFSILDDNNNPLFDDTTNDERMETRNQIFDRAFLKTLKYMNEKRGPYMKDWQWGMLHRAKFTMPLGKKKSLFRRDLMKSLLYRTGGDDSTILKGSVMVNEKYRSGGVTSHSVCFYGKSSYISRAVGASIHPESEFSAFHMDRRQFVDFESGEYKYEMRFVPGQ